VQSAITRAGFTDVSRLLAPRSIAVVGASDQVGNIGGAAVRFLQKFKSPSAVWPVNPGRETVAGLKCYPSVAALPAPADLAILAVPAAAVGAVVRECVAKGIMAGIVWAGGFADGKPEGRALQDALAQLCRETGFALLGPNCIGIIETHAPVIASFASTLLATEKLLAGNISMVSQSGGMATVGQAMAERCGYGFRYMISTGNEAVLTAADFIYALADDPKTKVIAAYIEGARDGAKFRQALEAARATRKPVIVLKAGATAASAGAAAAHTGALVGEGRVWDAILRETAAIQVESMEELLDVAMQLSGNDPAKLPRKPGVAVITFGGGSGVLAAEQCARVGLTVPALSAATREALRELVPPLASTLNPVDFTPQAYSDPKWLAAFPKALDTIAADAAIGTLFFQLAVMARGDQEMAGIISEFRGRTDKTVCVAWPLISPAAAAELRGGNVYIFPEHSRPVRTIARLADYAEAVDRIKPTISAGSTPFEWTQFIRPAHAGMVISEHECHRILAAAGLPVAAGQMANDAEAAARAAMAVGFPVAMKGISPAVTHRAAAGLVALNIRSVQEVKETDKRLREQAARKGIILDGIYVQHMVSAGRELLVSAFRDETFGPMVSVGAGGTMTELIDDVVLASAPLDEQGAVEALTRLRLLRKVTRDEVAGSAGLLRFVARFSQVAAAAPWRRFVLEVNPIKWSGDQVIAVDGLILIEQP
jgi:acetate---CoA ligase (ADP-forming)